MLIKGDFKGNGINVSKANRLQELKHFYLEPDNFYTLKHKFKPESLDFVYSEDINDTKFFKILLKEWFYSIKTKGKIIVQIKDNKILNFEQLIKTINLLLGGKGKIVLQDKKEGVIVYEKTSPALERGDSIDKWSFGIITDGSKIDVLEQQIQSIINLKIPCFEIIVCGPYSPSKKYKKYVKVIPFEYKIAWITRKKNLICQKAKYENMVITHNRFNFDKNWFKGIKKYGNYFEVLNCKILSQSGKRCGDWSTYGHTIRNRWINYIGQLDYRDWDENLLINGSFYILKKSVWRQCPWDESLVWGQKEDDALSCSFHAHGVVPRFNIYSIVYTFPEHYGYLSNHNYHFNKYRLGKLKFYWSAKYFARRIERIMRKYLKLGLVRESTTGYGEWKPK